MSTMLIHPDRFGWNRIKGVVQSIRFRLALWFVFILALILGVFSWFVYSRQAGDIKLSTLNRLETRARQVQTLYRFTGGMGFNNSQINLPDISQTLAPLLQSDEVVLFVSPQGQVLQQLGPVDTKDLNNIISLSINTTDNGRVFPFPFIETNTTTGKDYFYVFAPTPLPEDQFGVLIFGGLADPGSQLARLRLTLGLASLATLLVALLGSYWLADRAMRPVRVITRTAHEIGETDLSRRLNLHTGDELGELAETFDQMLDRLQAAFDRQRQFTADASHELRTPLTIVNLEADRALAARRSMDEYKQALSIIRSENDFMIQLVNDLLTLARMDAGQALLKLEPLDLSDLALDVVERLTPLAASKKVELLPGQLPELTVNGDRQYLIQMLTNLVENAIKYAGGEGKQVKVDTGISEDDHNHEIAWVRVADDGPGIAPDNIEHLFDRFYRVDKARSREEQPGVEVPTGSGLGLSIVQWIAKAHNGQVSVASEVGKGTVFKVLLPLADGG